MRNCGKRLEDTKKDTFSLQKVKKGTPHLTYPYVHGLYTIVLIKQIFKKYKSWRAVSGSRTQFSPKIAPDIHS